MTNRIADISPRKAARLAGVLYLLVMVFGSLSLTFVRPRFIVPGDAAATAHNIIASESLFRVGFVSELVHMTWFFLLALALYLLLKPVNKTLASLLVLLNLGAASIEMLNTLNDFAALSLLNGADYLTVFTVDQLYAQAMLFLNLHEPGYLVAQIFMGLWMLTLGYLVHKSGYLPRILGVLFIIGGFGLLIESFQYFLFPGYKVITYPGLVVSMIAEISFCLYALVKGIKEKKEKE